MSTRLPAIFSREAFLSSESPDELAAELARTIKARLEQANDPSAQEQACIEELIALGHPLRLFRSEGDREGATCEWFDNWEEPVPPGGDLFIGTSYERGSPVNEVDIEVTFHRR